MKEKTIKKLFFLNYFLIIKKESYTYVRFNWYH